MLRELIESRIKEWHDQLMADNADAEDIAESAQVSLADEGVVVSLDEIIEVFEDAQKERKSEPQLVKSILDMLEE